MRTDLPPEAFTKETLQQAFEWLQTQPEPVRTSIQTPEYLVSLYRKSQRLDQNSDAPVSSKKFIDDLKDLATSLNEFSAPQASVAPPVHTSASAPLQPPPPQASAPTSILAKPQAPVTQTLTQEPQVESPTASLSQDFFSTPAPTPVPVPAPVLTPAPISTPPAPTATSFSKNTLTATERTLKSTTVTETTQRESITINPMESLDTLSQERVAEVQKRFNIESPADALRLLISIGYEKFSQFP